VIADLHGPELFLRSPALSDRVHGWGCRRWSQNLLQCTIRNFHVWKCGNQIVESSDRVLPPLVRDSVGLAVEVDQFTP